MTGREALRALADGKRVRRPGWGGGYIFYSDDNGIVWCDGQPFYEVTGVDDWELVEPPATDEELIAEMERIGAHTDWRKGGNNPYYHCARMLRERKVKG